MRYLAVAFRAAFRGMRPPHVMPTGKGIVRSMRVWADLDLLLTASSITEAHQLTLDPDGRLGS